MLQRNSKINFQFIVLLQMKLLSYILALYVILLSGIPCCSFGNCAADKIEQNRQHNPGDSDCGDCSPFFTCSACNAFAFTIESLAIQAIPSNPFKIFAGYIESAVPDIHYDFWQPPKIV